MSGDEARLETGWRAWLIEAALGAELHARTHIDVYGFFEERGKRNAHQGVMNSFFKLLNVDTLPFILGGVAAGVAHIHGQSVAPVLSGVFMVAAAGAGTYHAVSIVSRVFTRAVAERLSAALGVSPDNHELRDRLCETDTADNVGVAVRAAIFAMSAYAGVLVGDAVFEEIQDAHTFHVLQQQTPMPPAPACNLY